MTLVQPVCFRLLETLDAVGQAYFRFKHTELWASFKICEILVDAHRIYKKWRSIPRYVKLLMSPDASRRVIAIQELESLCHKNTGTKTFSIRAVELGAVPGIFSCLNSGSPSAVCAALNVLSDIYSHTLCLPALDSDVLRQIFSLLKADDLYARVRSALLMALMTSEKSLESKTTSLVQSDHRFIKMLSDLIYRPLPDRYQNAIEFQGQQISASTLKHLKNCENQVRKSVIAILYKVAHDEDSITWESDLLVAIPVLIKAARDPDDIGLRIGAVGCLRYIARYETIRKSMGEYIVQYWKDLMPISRDIEVIEAIEVLAIYNDLAETLINEIFFFHRLPYLMNARDKSLKIIAYQSLYPFSTLTHYKWKIIQSGLLHVIIQGLYDGHRSIYMSALLCLSHLCTSNEAFLAVKAEISRQKPLPPCIGESLIFVVMSFPKQEMCIGSLKLLGEVLPKLKYLPQHIYTQLSASLHHKGDLNKKAKVAKLVSTISKVEKFRSKFLKSRMVNDLLCQIKTGSEPCKAAIYQALAELSVNNKSIAKKISDVKGFTDSLWIAQSSLDDNLAIAALELLRVLTECLSEHHHYFCDDRITVELPQFKTHNI